MLPTTAGRIPPENAPQPTGGSRPVRAQAVLVVALALGGAAGAVAREAIALALPDTVGRFPWATFTVNMSGSAVLGFLLVVLAEQFPRGKLVRPVVGTGIIGAYTTFSTFAVDAVDLVRHHHAGVAALYVTVSVAGGLVVAALGIAGGRLVIRLEHWLQATLS